MAEEHGCQTPEGHRLCANNCGFLGSSATMNLCSNCYGDLCLKQQSTMKATVESSSSSSVSPPSTEIASVSSPIIVQNPSVDLEIPVATKKKITVTPPPQTQTTTGPNRCTTCRKRVGLTGFKCRCGTMFCGVHRYPESHGCTFDFKSAGREEIAKANPLVKAAKLQKI